MTASARFPARITGPTRSREVSASVSISRTVMAASAFYGWGVLRVGLAGEGAGRSLRSVSGGSLRAKPDADHPVVADPHVVAGQAAAFRVDAVAGERVELPFVHSAGEH